LQAVALFLCNTFSSSKGSEWLMYSSTWKIDEVNKINRDINKIITFNRLNRLWRNREKYVFIFFGVRKYSPGPGSGSPTLVSDAIM
jgi:hypothetical protein